MEKGILTNDQRNELGELKERFNVLIEQLEKASKRKNAHKAQETSENTNPRQSDHDFRALPGLSGVS